MPAPTRAVRRPAGGARRRRTRRRGPLQRWVRALRRSGPVGRRTRRRTAVGVVAAVLLIATVVAVVSTRSAGDLLCVDAAGRPVNPSVDVHGYSGEQLANAKAIIDAGVAAGAPRDAQVIAVMTAMGESGLRVLDHGDTAGPDSRGLFQQRDNGAWGSLADRMDPATSAANFYRALLRLPDWQTLAPTVAAHRVQRNSEEGHYAPYWDAADDVVTTLSTRTLQCGSSTVD